MIGWIVLALWVVSFPFAWRYVFRAVAGGMITDGSDLALCICLAAMVGMMGGPVVLAYRAWMWHWNRRGLDAQQIANRLAGAPRESKDERIARLERENERLERELDIR